MFLKRRTPTKNRLEGPVKVIDSPMGVGKTTYMLDYVSRNKDRPYLIATPYLNEVSRWDKHIDHLEQPSTDDTPTKLEHLIELLTNKTSIITTHALFNLLNKDCLRLIRDGGYTLIIDETLNCIDQINIHSDDVDVLVEAGKLEIRQGYTYEHLEWVDDGYNGKIAKDIKKWIQAKEAIISNNAYFHIMRPDKIKSFTDVYILSYMFDSSLMASYFKLNGIDIPYEKHSINNGELVSYFDPMGSKYKELIDLNDQGKKKQKRLKRLDAFRLSKTFYDKATTAELTEIKNVARSYFDEFDTDKTLNMYTVFKDYETKIRTHRFKNIETDEKGNKKNTCFVSINTRATNDYAHKTRLAYLVNRYVNPIMKQMINKYGSSIDQDGYALSELIQWIFRSAIRNNEPISVFIPSKRMRKLLVDWLEG